MSGFADASHLPLGFSRALDVDEVPPEGLDLTISATEAERQALGAENGLEGLAKLEAQLQVTPLRAGGLAVSGEMRARVTQICVVTLEPFDSEVVEPIDVKFAPAPPSAIAGLSGRQAKDPRRGRRSPGNSEPPPKVLETDGEDPPDPIIDGRIDLGALAAEFLALSLDPHPRKPGVEFEESRFSEAAEAAESPFAKLEALKGSLPPRS
jgi:Large ribosomal RNA subunit accumulation protein YceD